MKEKTELEKILVSENDLREMVRLALISSTNEDDDILEESWSAFVKAGKKGSADFYDYFLRRKPDPAEAAKLNKAAQAGGMKNFLLGSIRLAFTPERQLLRTINAGDDLLLKASEAFPEAGQTISRILGMKPGNPYYYAKVLVDGGGNLGKWLFKDLRDIKNKVKTATLDTKGDLIFGADIPRPLGGPTGGTVITRSTMSPGEVVDDLKDLSTDAVPLLRGMNGMEYEDYLIKAFVDADGYAKIGIDIPYDGDGRKLFELGKSKEKVKAGEDVDIVWSDLSKTEPIDDVSNIIIKRFDAGPVKIGTFAEASGLSRSIFFLASNAAWVGFSTYVTQNLLFGGQWMVQAAKQLGAMASDIKGIDDELTDDIYFALKDKLEEIGNDLKKSYDIKEGYLPISLGGNCFGFKYSMAEGAVTSEWRVKEKAKIIDDFMTALAWFGDKNVSFLLGRFVAEPDLGAGVIPGEIPEDVLSGFEAELYDIDAVNNAFDRLNEINFTKADISYGFNKNQWINERVKTGLKIGLGFTDLPVDQIGSGISGLFSFLGDVVQMDDPKKPQADIETDEAGRLDEQPRTIPSGPSSGPGRRFVLGGDSEEGTKEGEKAALKKAVENLVQFSENYWVSDYGNVWRLDPRDGRRLAKISEIKSVGNEDNASALSEAISDYLMDILFSDIDSQGSEFDMGPSIIVGGGTGSGGSSAPATVLASPDAREKLKGEFGIQNPTASILEMWRSWSKINRPEKDDYEEGNQLRAFVWGMMSDNYKSGEDLGGRLDSWKATRDAEMKEWSLNALRGRIPEIVSQIELNGSYTLGDLESIQVAYVTGDDKIGDKNLIFLPVEGSSGPVIDRQDLIKITGFNPFPF